MQPDGFALPEEVRKVRAFWLREAARHVAAARRGEYRAWNLELAVDCRWYASNMRYRWLTYGLLPGQPYAKGQTHPPRPGGPRKDRP